MATIRLLGVFVFVVAAALLAAAAPGVAAQSPAGAPGPAMMGGAPGPTSDDCFNNLLNMSDCLTYVEDGSKQEKPDKGCCPELAGLVESHPLCLCQLLGNPDTIGIKIDVQRATKLPSVCGVETPPVSLCSVAGYPVSGLTPTEAPSPSEEAASSPTTGGTESGVSGNVVSQLSSIVCLAVVLLAAAF